MNKKLCQKDENFHNLIEIEIKVKRIIYSVLNAH